MSFHPQILLLSSLGLEQSVYQSRSVSWVGFLLGGLKFGLIESKKTRMTQDMQSDGGQSLKSVTVEMEERLCLDQLRAAFCHGEGSVYVQKEVLGSPLLQNASLLSLLFFSSSHLFLHSLSQ